MRLTLLTMTTCVWALPAMAEVSADEVWAAWKGASEGLTVGAELREGDVLVIRDAVWISKGGEETTTLPRIELRDGGDGVVVTAPNGAQVKREKLEWEGDTFLGVAFDVTSPDLAVVVAGESVETARYDLTAGKLTLEMTGLNGQPVSNDTLLLTLGKVKGQRTLAAGANDLALTIGQAELAQDSKGDGSQIRAAIQGMDIKGMLALPANPPDELADAVAAGLFVDFAYKDGGAQFSLAQQDDDGEAVVTLAAKSMQSAFGIGPDGLSAVYRYEGVSLGLLADFQRWSGEGALHAEAAMEGAGFALDFKAPVEAMADAIEGKEALAMGMQAGLSVQTGTLDANLTVTGGGEPGTAKLALGGGALDFKIDRTSFDTGWNLTGLSLSGEGFGGMPALDLSLGDVTQRFTMPTGVVGEPAPMTILSRISDLRMSDAIWDQFDAGRIFPRDPVNLLIDLQGMVTLRVPLWEMEEDFDSDPESFEMKPTPDIPMELNSLKIAGLSASGFGVDLKGSGAAQLDFSEVMTEDDIPAGNANLQLDLTGVQTLLDKLQEAGLLSGDELTGARMGLMMIAKATGDGDKMTSSMELRDGRVYLNGMMIR